jgi:acetylornithine deacetylase
LKEPPEQVLSMNKASINTLQEDAIELLKKLIATPSFSREEEHTATLLEVFLQAKGIEVHRHINNIVARNRYFDPEKPTILLNSHHDTVKPNKAYTLDPYTPIETDGKLYGLGSNDAGGSLVSLIATFVHFYDQPTLAFNLILAATAEEEISGKNGVESVLPLLGKIDCAVVGEPTLLQMAVAERGLMVLDCTAYGKAGHAARGEGVNAIYKALKDIEWMHSFQFERVSSLIGPVTMNVTVIETDNKAHNVVPAQCRFVADVRINERYSFEEVLATIRANVESEVVPRSDRLRSTMIPLDHPLVQAGLSLGKTYYGSPTSSDKALMPFPALKLGPGDSARSHTADEFIFINEINEGIELYIQLLNRL